MTALRYPRALRAALLLLLLVLAARGTRAQLLAPAPNGSVRAVLRAGNTVYVGGQFTAIGPNAPFGVLLDATSGLLKTRLPAANGSIDAVAPDGNGGWYLGGAFTRIGGAARRCLAQINSAGKVTAWNPDAGSYVNTLAVSGPTVYAGGAFTTVNGTTARNYVAAFDAATGTATSWNPDVNSEVNVLVVSGTTVYAGGSFTTVNGGTVRNRLAAFHATTGTATSWHPNVNNTVFALAVAGATIYAGGAFNGANSVNGTTVRNRLAAFDATTGTATAWDPNANDAVRVLLISGATVYAGGAFTGINGTTTRNRLAALDIATGTATAWNPNVGGDVLSLAVSGSTVYAGGSFQTVNGGTLRFRAAAFDAATGTASSWNPNMSGDVTALAVAGSSVFAGGVFTLINQVSRNGLAAFNATTGAISAWNPGLNGAVYSLAASGATVYAGGSFTTANGGAVRNRLAAFDTATGIATAWNPNVSNTVYALVVSGSTVYAGGAFSGANSVNGNATRNRLAAFDATTGTATSWNPNVNGTVYALASFGPTVFAGGAFSGTNSVNGTTVRNRLAAFDPTAGIASSWNPNLNGTVRALVLSGGALYAGGDFNGTNSANGNTARNYLAAFTISSGTVTGWNPDLDGGVYALAAAGATVYAGGYFSTANGTAARNNLASFDATSGMVSAWNPGADDITYTLAVSGSNVLAGGDFVTVAGANYAYAPKLAAFETASGAVVLPLAVQSFTARAAGGANQLSWAVAGEQEGTAYTVERSATGAGFEPIGTVRGSASSAYDFTDAPVRGTAYYRLRIEGSGAEAYSPVAVVRRGGASAGSITLAPQPASGTLVIASTDAALAGTPATVLDLQGREVARFLLDARVALDVSGWAPGLYALRLADGSVLRLVRQ